MPMRPDEDDDLLSDCRFSQMRMPPRAPGIAHMPKKVPPPPAGSSAKRAATGDLWCCLMLAFLCFGSYGLWSVPSHDRSLANFETRFESKLNFVKRALGGELEKENRHLSATLQSEEQKEEELHKEDDILRKELVEAHKKEDILQRRLTQKESSYALAQKDIVQTRSGLENWHRKSETFQTKLALVQKDIVQRKGALQHSQQEAAKAEHHARQLEASLAGARKSIAELQASARGLRGQLQHEEHWHQDTVQKFRRYKEAEQTLMKSIDIR